MAIASNGVWGNLGVGSAALIAGYFIDNGGWRLAFIVPGAVACLLGIAYAALFVVNRAPRIATAAASVPAAAAAASAGGATAFANPGSRSGARVGALAHREPEHHRRSLIVRLGAIVLFTTALSGLIFQSTTFALPKIFDERLGVFAGSASTVGWITFLVFAVASLAQLLVGRLIDQVGPRRVFVTAAIVQASAFALMPGLTGAAAVAAAIAFTFGAFGQIPINDYMIGRLASPERRASIYGVRFVVTFVVLAAALPLVATVHAAWGFDALFRILACAALLVLAAAWALPRNLPENLDAAPDAAPAKPA